MDILTNQYFLLALTFGVYAAAQWLQRVSRSQFLNPILLTIAFMIVYLMLTHTGYDDYQESGKYIDFWLKPAVVALAVPLYKQLSAIRKQLIPLLIAEVVGCVIGIVSVVLGSASVGCHARGSALVGRQVSDHAYSYGGDAHPWWNSAVDSSCGDLYRYLWRYDGI